jgi:hypothetical protein
MAKINGIKNSITYLSMKIKSSETRGIAEPSKNYQVYIHRWEHTDRVSRGIPAYTDRQERRGFTFIYNIHAFVCVNSYK